MTHTEKLTTNDLKLRIKYMLVHLIATTIMLFGLFIGIIHNNCGMIVFNTLLGLFNIYFFYGHYDKLLNAIEQLTPPNVKLEKD